MSEAGISKDQFSFPVYLDILKNPVAIPCGPSFCMECVNDCWDQEDLKGIYSCSQCRRSFNIRPEVRKNTMLAEMEEELKKTMLQTTPPAHSSTGPEDMEGDIYTGRKHKALQSCLVFLACEAHHQPHNNEPGSKICNMAKASISVDQFSFPVYLDLLKDPVTLPCGQSFCMMCIKGCWDQEDQKGIYSCPQCRRSFNTRPDVSKNTMLAEVVEQLRKTRLQTPPPAHSSTGPEDVECDECTGTKHKAVQSCLVCLASYCETHLQLHYQSPTLKKHQLVKASRRLQEQICSQHDKLLELYCRTDQQCICLLCTMDDHKGHNTVSVAAERAEKQKQLVETQRKHKERIQEREKELQELTEAVKSHKRSAQTAVEDSDEIFTEMIRSIERRRSQVREMIRAQEKAAVSRAEEHLKRLEEEITELKRRDTELEKLSFSEDHIHFLQSFQTLSAPPGSSGSPAFLSRRHNTFDFVTKSVSQLREKIEEFWEEEFAKTSAAVKKVQIILPPEPQSREDFLEYSCQLTLDPNTVNKYLILSEGNTAVTDSTTVQPYPDHPDRFKDYYQVLCRESVSGRCYWEVEWRSGNGLGIAVSYKSISRKGSECWFGRNDQSWSLDCYSSRYTFIYNNEVTEISRVPDSSRIGVYVDHRAGTLSFYSVSDTMTLIHRVQTTFTQPLYAGFWLYPPSSVNLLTK